MDFEASAFGSAGIIPKNAPADPVDWNSERQNELASLFECIVGDWLERVSTFADINRARHVASSFSRAVLEPDMGPLSEATPDLDPSEVKLLLSLARRVSCTIHTDATQSVLSRVYRLRQPGSRHMMQVDEAITFIRKIKEVTDLMRNGV